MDRTSDSDRSGLDDRIEVVVKRETRESASRAIVQGITAVKGAPETELDPPFEHIDVDALEKVVCHAEEHGSDVAVEFEVDGRSVPRPW